jgi:hypothetical protein
VRSAAKFAWFGGIVLIVTGVSLSGCFREYDKPEYVEVGTAETAFVVPLEGDTTNQAKFQSEKYLEQRKVAAKRIQIQHRWSQEGRLHTDGRWIAAVKVIKVDRSPVTREWTADGGTGTERANQAIWVESADSVGFSTGFTCTAMIDEADASRFLYWYPSGSLAQVMDTEVRARVQQNAAEVAAKYPLDALRAKKQEMVDLVRSDAIPFFKQRGITITTISIFGGMTYENPEIQKAIDKTFIAQQEKVVNMARLEAQQKENERIELEATSLAERVRREAQGRGDAKVTEAKAEAQAIREVAQALAEAGKNPAFIQLRALEVETSRTERWDGKYPLYYMGGGGGGAGGPNLLLNVPAPQSADVSAVSVPTTRPAQGG